jgi:hypothetical protein
MTVNSIERKFFIAGVQFHPGAANIIRDLVVGDDLDLVPEPTNKFDPNAVRIESAGELLGYVPKKFSAEISALIEIEECECIVTIVNPNGKTWEMCEVVVRPVITEDEEADLEEEDEYPEEEEEA